MVFEKGDVLPSPDPAYGCEIPMTTGAQPRQVGDRPSTCWWQDDGEEAISAAGRDDAPRHIGALAAQLGLNPKTIRYYEQLGLLLPPTRTEVRAELVTLRREAAHTMHTRATQAEVCGIIEAHAGATHHDTPRERR